MQYGAVQEEFLLKGSAAAGQPPSSVYCDLEAAQTANIPIVWESWAILREAGKKQEELAENLGK